MSLLSSKDSVNKRIKYGGTTVFLDTDLDLAGKSFEPISNSSSNYFSGTYDGQVRTISNLKIESTSFVHPALFGICMNFTIRNTAISSSSSITSFYKSSGKGNSYIANTVGIGRACLIENIVNMADLTYSGDTGDHNLHFGGIVGWLESKEYTTSSTRNCVNYGTLTYSGKSTGVVEIGGIVSIILHSYNKTLIQNCANYGKIISKGPVTMRKVYLTGIVSYGHDDKTTIENCLSVGKIESNKESDFIGSIVKRRTKNPLDCNITNSFWTGDVGYGNEAEGFNYTLINSYPVEKLNKTTANELNSYMSEKSGWTSWFTLHLNGGRINDNNQTDLIVTQNQFPDPAISGNTFVGWFKDAACTQLVYPRESNGVDLYAC